VKTYVRIGIGVHTMEYGYLSRRSVEREFVLFDPNDDESIVFTCSSLSMHRTLTNGAKVVQKSKRNDGNED
jgi:hypothetical protein